MSYFPTAELISLADARTVREALAQAEKKFEDTRDFDESLEFGEVETYRGPVLSHQQAEKLAYERSKDAIVTTVLPVSSRESVTEQSSIPFVVDEEQFAAYLDLDGEERLEPASLMGALGVDIVERLGRNPDSVVHASVQWDRFESRLDYTLNVGRVVPRYKVEVDADDRIPGVLQQREAATLRVGFEMFTTHKAARDAIRKVVSEMDHQGLSFRVVSQNVRVDASNIVTSESMSEFQTVVTKAEGTLTLTLTDQDDLEQDGWLVSFFYHS